MLYVKTRVGPSKIHGVGLFADEPIQQGQVVWRFTPGFDQAFTQDELLALPHELRRFLGMYAYKSRTSGRYILPADNDRFVNHSTTPNTLSAARRPGEEVTTVALRDIEPGEELTDNYESFEDSNDRDNALDGWANHHEAAAVATVPS